MATTELIDQETELKERLKSRIDSTHNLAVLRGVLSLMNEIDVYELSPEEERMLDEAQQDTELISGEESARKTREFLRSLCKNSD